MLCESCQALGIPDRLCSEDKPNIFYFKADEILYRRTSENLPDDILKTDLKIVERIFKLEDDSYNRSSVSEPEDVLINDKGEIFHDYSVIGIPLNSLASLEDFEYDDGKHVCKFVPEYSPLPCNYAHSEISCYIDDIKRDGNKPPKSVRRYFREEIMKLWIRIETRQDEP